jgi:ABC-type branched-subunit amino acid transport system ATPase component
MLMIARGLFAQPKVVLLDEPSLGLAPAIIKDMHLDFGNSAEHMDIQYVCELTEQLVPRELSDESCRNAVVLLAFDSISVHAIA